MPPMLTLPGGVLTRGCSRRGCAGLGQAREVGQPRREADEVHVVGGPAWSAATSRGEPEPRGGVRQLEAELVSVAARQLDGPRRGQDVRARPRGQRGQSRHELRHTRSRADRSTRGARGSSAPSRRCPDPVGSNQIVEGEHARRHVAPDLVGQLHGQRPVPAREKPRLGIDRHSGLKPALTGPALGLSTSWLWISFDRTMLMN